MSLLTDPEVHTKLCGEAELGTMFALGALAVAWAVSFSPAEAPAWIALAPSLPF